MLKEKKNVITFGDSKRPSVITFIDTTFLIPYLNLLFVIYLKTSRKLSKQHSSKWEGVLCVSKKVVQLTGRGMPGKAIPGITDVILLGKHFKYVDKKQSTFLE